jgi:hypothetical protein
VQNGTRHAWRNRSDQRAVIVSILIGAPSGGGIVTGLVSESTLRVLPPWARPGSASRSAANVSRPCDVCLEHRPVEKNS